MANTIILKRSATPGKVPTTAQLALGEIAINTYDGLIYIKKDDGTPSVVQIGGVTSVNGETGAVTIDTGDVAENGNLYFTNARARSAVSAGTGISYNSSTGVISTSQSITTSASPTFAGLTLTGGISSISGDIIPSADITYSLGSASKQWKDIFVGPGSLYVNGSKVLEDVNDTITFSADVDQNIRIKTLGLGILQLGSSTTTVEVDGTLQLLSGKRITDSAGVNVQFGNPIHMNSNKITNLGAPSSNTDAATKKYVDDTVGTISTSSITNGDSNVTVTDTGTGTVTVTVDGTTALTVDATGVVVAGNFTVSGTTTTVNSNTVSVADNILTLNSDVTGTPTQNAGIEVERGDEANVQIRWNEGGLKWTFTNDGAVYNPIPVTTTDLTEGTNQYFTTARARSSLSATSATGVSYNSSTGVISLGSIPNSSLTNSAITINGVSTSLGGTRTLGTDDVAEGSTNQYFTTARARSSVSAGTGISYNSTTGVIATSAIPNSSLTNSKVTVGTTDISLGGSSTTLAGLTSVTSTSFTGALTGNADTATSAGKWTTARTITLAGDLTGSVSIDGSAGVTLTATVAANSVALGTDTTGNYMSDVTAGTGITVTHTPGEGSNATIAVDTSTIATKSYVDSQILTKDNTDEITEGTTNLYFTNARARGAVSASTGLSYNSTTGAFSIDTATTVDKTTAQTLTNKSLSDSTTYFIDETDGTKKLQFQLSGITTGTTRTLTAPDVNGTIITTGDTGTVTNTMLAGSIANSKLTNSSVTVGTTAISLGGSSTTLAGLTSVTSTGFTGALTGNADTATKLATARAINGVNFDGSAAITVKASTTNALTIGTGLGGTSFDGSSAVTITNTGVTSIAGTANQITASASTGGVTLSLPSAVTMPGDLTVTGNLTVSGTTTTVSSTTLSVADKNIELAKGSSTDAAADGGGITLHGTTDHTWNWVNSTAAWTSSDHIATAAGKSHIFNGATSGTITLTPAATAGTTTITLPATTGTLVTTGDTGTVTNTMLAGSIANSKLANSTISGVALGSNLNTLTLATSGTGLSGSTTYNGSGAATFTVTSNATSANTANTIVARGASGEVAHGALTVTGAITATGEVTAYFSDLRLKTNIVPIADALDKVEALNGVTFDPNETALALGIDARHQMGVIAQEVEAVAPELVCDSAFAGYKTVRYDKLTALLIEAVKDLSAKVKTLEAQLGNTKPTL